MIAEHQIESRVLTREQDKLLARGRPTEEIVEYWPLIDLEEIESISKEPPVKLVTAEELIEKAAQLKRPAKGTVREWQNTFRLFSEFTGNSYPLSATRDDAQEFRDHLLAEYKVSTV